MYEEQLEVPIELADGGLMVLVAGPAKHDQPVLESGTKHAKMSKG